MPTKLVKLGKAPPGPAGGPKLNPDQKQKLAAISAKESFHLYEALLNDQKEGDDESFGEEGLSDDDLRLIQEELRAHGKHSDRSTHLLRTARMLPNSRRKAAAKGRQEGLRRLAATIATIRPIARCLRSS